MRIKERIGIFGGTFNPIHSGHLVAAGFVQRKFSLDKILFIPSYIPPHKKMEGIASPLHRLRMVELALKEHSRFLPCSMEIDAREKSYSIITLNKIKRLYPRAWLFFILGADAFLEIETWKHWKSVLEQCLFIVISRPGFRLKEVKKVLQERIRDNIFEISPSQKVVEEWFSSYRVFLLAIKAFDISATEIRRRIHEGRSIRRLLQESVLSYIKEHQLYR
ncbi:MAG: nicotinate-nucleotide adenylyltransferase [Candidatus Aminicenantales bacterium]